MTISALTIPAALANDGISQMELARQLGVDRSTILKYKDDIDGAGHAIVNGMLMTRTMIHQGVKVKSRKIELLNERRQQVKEFVASKNGIKGIEIERILGLKRSRAAVILLKIVRMGDIYKSGNNSGSVYWIDENHFLNNRVIARKKKPRKFSERGCLNDASAALPVIRRREPSPIVFLSRKRPAGVNTVFQECKENFKILLPVLEVMARGRRHEAELVRS